MEEEVKKAPRPFLIIQKVDPSRDPSIKVDKDDIEGVQLLLGTDGRLIPETAEAFIADMAVSKIPNSRSVVLTTRLRNNFLINESATALTLEEYDEDTLIEECKARTIMKIFDYLQFVWCCGSVTNNSLKAEMPDVSK